MSNIKNKTMQITKLETGISGFDFMANGGLPEGRTTLIAGTAGSGKTIVAVQFLAEGILKTQQGGVFITFEESPADIRRNMQGFGWDTAQMGRQRGDFCSRCITGTGR